MFNKILVANRGEIALRIVRACNELGIKTVAVYSEADSASLHLRLSDEQICIGPPISSKSYLNIENIIAAARKTGAAAIHPGYGYLSEKPEFAAGCRDAGIVFIGPSVENLELAGNKIAAKKTVAQAGVPVIPGSGSGVTDIAAAVSVSQGIGYPVVIKAAGGGGGRGIRICRNEASLREDFAVATAEAAAAFGQNETYIEKFIPQPRHIEFQILADGYGDLAHLGERECTIQRRYQKLIEESPSPRLTPNLRKAMGEAALRAAAAAHYVNAGTVEFLLDADDNFYFMEINARLQVEHPLTELVTGIDLVKEQIRLAAQKALNYSSEDIDSRGWAIECRINAEDPDRRFLPCPGVVETYHPPGGFGVRLDTHLYAGYELPIFYDSLIAKLICHARSREAAIAVMKRALREFQIMPLKTTIPLYRKIMEDGQFCRGEFHTGYIHKFIPEEDAED